MMKALRSSKKSVLARTTRRNIPEDNILDNHRRENPQIIHSIRLGSVAEK
jgi:hypothetical protein